MTIAARSSGSPDAQPVPGSIVGAERRRRVARYRTVTLALAVLALLSFLGSILTGTEDLAIGTIFQGVLGAGDQVFIVRELRLPRTLVGLMVGAAFGLSGALFQTLMRNPLASPDLIGITAGASAAGVFSILVLQLGGFTISLAALGGALLAGGVIYLLARKGGVSGYRLVLVGIGMNAMLQAVISFLMTRSEVREAQYALSWLVGSLNGRVWTQVQPLFLALLVVFPPAFVLSRPLRVLQLGDEIASGLGVRLERSRLWLLLVAVAAAAVGTAAAGPVSFVALVSAPIARRLIPTGALSLVPSMLVGSSLVLLSDIAAQKLIPGITLPVGVVTGAVGAPYLLWLLARTNKLGKG